MDPVTCCLLGICCPPFSQEQRDTYEAQLSLHFNGDAAKAKKVCDATFDDFAKMTEKLGHAIQKAEIKG